MNRLLFLLILFPYIILFLWGCKKEPYDTQYGISLIVTDSTVTIHHHYYKWINDEKKRAMVGNPISLLRDDTSSIRNVCDSIQKFEKERLVRGDICQYPTWNIEVDTSLSAGAFIDEFFSWSTEPHYYFALNGHKFRYSWGFSPDMLKLYQKDSQWMASQRSFNTDVSLDTFKSSNMIRKLDSIAISPLPRDSMIGRRIRYRNGISPVAVILDNSEITAGELQEISELFSSIRTRWLFFRNEEEYRAAESDFKQKNREVREKQ